MTLQDRMVRHRSKHQTLFVVILAQNFVITQIKLVANAESRTERNELKLKLSEQASERKNCYRSIEEIGFHLYPHQTFKAFQLLADN